MHYLKEAELSPVLEQTKHLFEDVKGRVFFLTGGTGFFGKWFTESFLFLNERLSLGATLIILSRDPEFHLEKFPLYANQPGLKFVKGDISSFSYPEESIDYIIHAATEASVSLNLSQPLVMFDAIVAGTRRVLDLAVEKKVRSFLLTSSGAVYGPQPEDISHMAETFAGSPDIFSSGAAYGEGKRVAEMLGNLYYLQHGIHFKVARCFAFAGPFLPLDSHFAIGNFIRNILDNKTITIQGDGTPRRSYLYASDLMTWLWTILFDGKPGVPYNVGSERAVSIEELAHMVRSVTGASVGIEIMQKKTGRLLQYVPDVSRIKSSMGVKETVSLEQAIEKMYKFHIRKSV